jgi:ubiquitin-small subunit ribosomal protein S27Ae
MANKPAKKGPADYNVSALYEKKEGNIIRKNKNCPKCGPGFFMAQHENRTVCGKCNYAEFKTGKK